MIGPTGAALRALFAIPALRAVLLGALCAAVLGGAVVLYLRDVRADAADAVRRDLNAQQNQEVKDAIERSKAGPRPSGDEFLDCLRIAGPGCL